MPPVDKRDRTAGRAPSRRISPSTQNADDDERIERIDRGHTVGAGTLPLLRRRRQRFAVDHPDDPVDAGGNAAGEIPAPEFRRDDLVDDALGGDVGQRAFEAVADLDAQLAVVLGDDQQRAVVDLLAPDLPGFGDPDRILLDRLRLRSSARSAPRSGCPCCARMPSASASARRCRRSTASRSDRRRVPTAAAPRRRPRPRRPSTAVSARKDSSCSVHRGPVLRFVELLRRRWPAPD